jgi:hypothetical protein
VEQELEQDKANEIVETGSGGKLLVVAGSPQQLVNRLAGAKTIGMADFQLHYRF